MFFLHSPPPIVQQTFALCLQMKPSKCFEGQFSFLLTKPPLIAPLKYFLASLHPNKVPFISIRMVVICNFVAVPDACML